MKCIYCNHPKTYKLSSGQKKCAKCKKKFSIRKVENEKRVVECFCENLTIRECSKKYQLHYITVKKRYDEFRKKIAIFMEEDFQRKEKIDEFDEYLYLEKNKRRDKKHIFDAYNFLTFSYDNKIYNLLMPDFSRYKPAFLEDSLEDIYYKEFEKFLRKSRISKNTSNQSLIIDFWQFFEEFILKFKGISRENFIYYLKEAEFKFNFDCKKLRELIFYKPPKLS